MSRAGDNLESCRNEVTAAGWWLKKQTKKKPFSLVLQNLHVVFGDEASFPVQLALQPARLSRMGHCRGTAKEDGGRYTSIPAWRRTGGRMEWIYLMWTGQLQPALEAPVFLNCLTQVSECNIFFSLWTSDMSSQDSRKKIWRGNIEERSHILPVGICKLTEIN